MTEHMARPEQRNGREFFDPNAYDYDAAKPDHVAARMFMESVGLTPTPDAIDQLVEAFLPSLRIMCERGYDPNGGTWRDSGWRGQILEIKKKTERLWERSWRRGKFDPDSAQDLVNYAAFYLRLKGQEPQWGSWGEPGGNGQA